MPIAPAPCGGSVSPEWQPFLSNTLAIYKISVTGALWDGRRLTFCESVYDSSCQALAVNSTISMNFNSRICLTSFIGSEAT